MAPHHNTRSGLRASQQVEIEQQIEDTRYSSRSSSPSSSYSSSHSKSSPKVEDEQSSQDILIPQMKSQQPCFFLDAHPEIRNDIYRLVLVSDDPIEVGATDALPLDPPLLRTNRQIRSEARGIFYKENTVKFTVLDYDVRKIVRWVDRSPAHHDICTNMHLQLSVSSPWVYCHHAMLNWAYAYFQGRCGRLTLESSSLAPNDTNAKDVDRLEIIAMFDALDNHPMARRFKSDPDTLRTTLRRYHGVNMKGTLWFSHAPLRHFSYETLYWDKYWHQERAPSPHDPFGLRKGPLAPSPSALTRYMNAPAPPLPSYGFPMLSGPMNGGPRPR